MPTAKLFPESKVCNIEKTTIKLQRRAQFLIFAEMLSLKVRGNATTTDHSFQILEEWYIARLTLTVWEVKGPLEHEPGNDGWEPIILDTEPASGGWKPTPEDHDDPLPETGLTLTDAWRMRFAYVVLGMMQAS